jgi:hypothetical protein
VRLISKTAFVGLSTLSYQSWDWVWIVATQIQEVIVAQPGASTREAEQADCGRTKLEKSRERPRGSKEELKRKQGKQVHGREL